MFVIVNYLIVLPVLIRCDRIPPSDGGRSDIKVEMDLTYWVRLAAGNVRVEHKTISYSFLSAGKAASTDVRGGIRQNGQAGNLRHPYRYSGIEKGSSAYASFDADGADSTQRVRASPPTIGPLVHIVGVNGSHNGCTETANTGEHQWIALVDAEGCPVEAKYRNFVKMQPPPHAVLMYSSARLNAKQEAFVNELGEDPPMMILLPWSHMQFVVSRCTNSTGRLRVQSQSTVATNRSSSLPPMISVEYQLYNQCNMTLRMVFSSDDNFLNKTSVLFVSVSFILLMVISLAWLMFYYVQRFRYIHTKEQFSRRLAHMAKKAVAKIPVKTLKQGDRETDPDVDNCAICIECYKPSDTVRILPCKHYFHKSCIDPWLLEQRSCPMCKLNILHAYGFLPNERGSMVSDEHLSELDSSLELQFLSGIPVPHYPPATGASTRVQAHCPTRDSVSDAPQPPVLPPIFTEPRRYQTIGGRWASLRLKRLSRSNHRIDRSVSLRYLSVTPEERATFLSHGTRPLSQSATDTVAVTDQETPPAFPSPSASSSSTTSQNSPQLHEPIRPL